MIEVLTTKRYELINITDKVEDFVKKSNIEKGLVLVFVPHSTAGIVLTEDESGLKEDWIDFLEKTVSGFEFLHTSNADSHILSGLLGQSKVLPIEKKKIIRGVWQDIFLLELDGPKTRKIIMKVVGSRKDKLL